MREAANPGGKEGGGGVRPGNRKHCVVFGNKIPNRRCWREIAKWLESVQRFQLLLCIKDKTKIKWCETRSMLDVLLCKKNTQKNETSIDPTAAKEDLPPQKHTHTHTLHALKLLLYGLHKSFSPHFSSQSITTVQFLPKCSVAPLAGARAAAPQQHQSHQSRTSLDIRKVN